MSDSSTSTEPAPTRRDWGALAVLSLGLAMIVLDGTIVGVALSTIITDLDLDLSDAQWVNGLYAVLLAALLLSTGRLADRRGRRRMFLVGIVVFVMGSSLAAASDTGSALIGARAVQAVGAALIMPSTLSTVNATFRGEHRAAAFGVWGAVISGAAAVGPLAGGALTQYASWEWIFLVNIPFGALIFLAALVLVPETKGVKGRPGADVDGALLSAVGFGALVFAVIQGPEVGWWRPTQDLSQLRDQGTSSDLGAETDTVILALSEGLADATRASLLVASLFLLLGFVGAVRVRSGARRIDADVAVARR